MATQDLEKILKKSLNELEQRLENSFQKRLDVTVAEVKALILNEFEEKISSGLNVINERLAEIEKSQSFLSNQYDTFRSQVGYLLNENTKIKTENESLVIRIRNLEQQGLLRSKAIDDLEQYGRRSMIEIGGIPRNEKENCEQIVLNLASKLDVNLKENDIDACHRISNKSDAAIIVKFSSRKLSAKMLSKETKSKCKKLCTTDLGFPAQNQEQEGDAAGSGKIFLNESLTLRRKNLLRLAKIKKKDLDFKFLWTQNGIILMRKREKSGIKKINSEDDLDNLQLE